MRTEPSALLVGLLLVTAGCIGGGQTAPSTTTPTPRTGTPTETASPTPTLRTPSAEMLERERELLEQGLSHSFWTTSWADEYPGANHSAWGTNRTARALGAIYEGSYFHVESICYDGRAEQAFLEGTLTRQANVSGYEPFTVSVRVVAVPVVPQNTSESPIARVEGVDAYDCDATLARSG